MLIQRYHNKNEILLTVLTEPVVSELVWWTVNINELLVSFILSAREIQTINHLSLYIRVLWMWHYMNVIFKREELRLKKKLNKTL